jgi:hypothetical protein
MPFLHFGDHAGLNLRELAAHLFEADHLVFAAVTLLVGISAYRYGRRVEAREHVQRKGPTS